MAAWMARELQSKPGDELYIETDAGVRVCTVNAIDYACGFNIEVTAGMGVPSYSPKTVMLADGSAIEGIESYTGNPHFVIRVESTAFEVAGKSWQTIGAGYCVHSDFPQQTNLSLCALYPQTK